MSEYTRHFNDCDAVPIKVNRVFDSCSDKDCVTGVQVNLDCKLPPEIAIVKSRCITVSDVCMNVEEIPFNKGFFSVDLTFSLDVQLLGYEKACGDPVILTGTATVSKNCILYGSETNSKTFYSDGTSIGTTGSCCNTINPPSAAVQVVSPIVLEAKIVKGCQHCDCGCSESSEFQLPPPRPQRDVVLTLGLFYVVELTRPVTIIVPTYNYTIPQKECCADMASPCEIFDKIKFPVEEFSPSKLENNNNCGCTYPAERSISQDDCGCQDI